MSDWVVFTDLDESLLDRERYAFEDARPALEELRKRAIPLVFCSSKTAAESLHFQERLGIAEPFVVEGGGGIYVPKGYFAKLPGETRDRGGWELLPLSAEYDEILKGLGHIKEFTANSVRGFDDLSVEELAQETGLPLEMAARAKRREFDEPFRFVRREEEYAAHLSRLANERGLRVSKGGRYYHLHGDTDKGRAVRVLKQLFRAKRGAGRTAGLGDSEMDMPMLAEVERPVIIPRHDGTIDPVLETNVRTARRAPRPGPAGWNEAVLELLREPRA